jgi:hypothetical protein
LGGVSVAYYGFLSNFSAAQLAAISPAALAGVSVSQITGIYNVYYPMKAETIAGLGTSITGLSPAALAAIGGYNPNASYNVVLTPAQVTALGSRIGELSTAAFANLGATQVDGLTTAQMGVLGARGANLSAAALGSLDASQLAGATLNALNATQLGALTAGQAHRREERHPSHGQRNAGTKVVKIAFSMWKTGGAVITADNDQRVVELTNFLQSLQQYAERGVQGLGAGARRPGEGGAPEDQGREGEDQEEAKNQSSFFDCN